MKLKINNMKWKAPVLIGVASEGLVRIEWSNARHAPVIPINWMASGIDINYGLIGFNIDDAYNLMTKQALELDVQWLLIIEDDVIIPPNFFIEMNKHMKAKKAPIVSGLYFSKGKPSEPLVFRGRGNGCWYGWKMGELVWCDGIPMGCLLVHMSVLRYVWDRSETYRAANGELTNRVFVTPRKVDFTMEPFHYTSEQGTQDLYFCDRLLEDNRKALRESGWKAVARRKYPFLVDTKIFCKHIDRHSGKMYPL